jgi:hypothetical protein
MKKLKQLRVLTLLFIIFAIVTVGFGCSPRTTVQLENVPRTTVQLEYVPAAILNGSLSITNNTQEIWTNVRLTLNGSFTYLVKEILPQQTVSIPARDFTHNGESLAPSLLGHGSMLDLKCDLPSNREGTFTTLWHS